MSILPTGVYVDHVSARCPRRLEEDIGSPGTGITDVWQLPSGFLEPNLGPLQEHLALITSEPSL